MADFEKAVIVGVGLLGGSIGFALQEQKIASQVVGLGRNLDRLQKALELGAVNQIETDLTAACSGADLCVVCTPVQKIAENVLACQKHMVDDALITDVGSTKHTICSTLSASGVDTFCGSHPLAGSDRSGVTFADGKLFEGRMTVVTPVEDTPNALQQRTVKLWQGMGSRTVTMAPQDHDRALAQTSHLPHVVSSALAAGTPDELLQLVATGWEDTTRISAGNAQLWTQIIQENKASVQHALQKYSDSLQDWLAALQQDDFKKIEALLEAGKQKRDSLGS